MYLPIVDHLMAELRQYPHRLLNSTQSKRKSKPPLMNSHQAQQRGVQMTPQIFEGGLGSHEVCQKIYQPLLLAYFELSSTQLDSAQFSSAQLSSTQLNAAQFSSIQLNSAQLSSTFPLQYSWQSANDRQVRYVCNLNKFQQSKTKKYLIKC